MTTTKENPLIHKYSPNEIFNYAQGMGCLDSLYYATNNNYLGYMRIAAEGEIILGEDDHPYLSLKEQYSMEPIQLDDSAKASVGTKLAGHLVSHGGVYSMCMLGCEDNKCPDVEDPKFIAASKKLLILDFLKKCKIDTIPKLEKVLQDEKDIMIDLTAKVNTSRFMH